ncbi:hypothetical protein GCM10022261_15220 [Brevibacterium daeguense]|uniref:Uncharacterized protein n=2 Tax=Brevibacterium daeguense TaxID=909936 RepID=A0ABP8EJ65_9MICO
MVGHGVATSQRRSEVAEVARMADVMADKEMAMDDFEIVEQQDGEYLFRIGAGDETASVTLSLTLDGAEAASDGQLADNEATARATVRYLLEHQDADDLPEQVALPDVLVAYPGAIDRIVRLRD